jgi:hypothetical protein
MNAAINLWVILFEHLRVSEPPVNDDSRPSQIIHKFKYNVGAAGVNLRENSELFVASVANINNS